MRHRSQVENYLHIVWTTYRRHPFLTADMEPRVQGCIGGEVQRLGATLLAIGGIEDHVHLVILLPSNVCLSRLVQQAKGVSSKLAGEIAGPLAGFKWQEGYHASSLSRPHCQTAIAYVGRQKERHADGKLWPQWEPE